MQENTKKNLSINDRIIQILDYYGVTRYKFSQETGISEAVLLNIYKGKNKPSADFIERLLNKYKAVDGNWLITGEGTMLKSSPAKVEETEPPPYKTKCNSCIDKERIIDALKESLKAKDISISSLIGQIELLKEQIYEAHQQKGEQKRKAG